MMSSKGPSPDPTRGTLHCGDGKWGLGESFRDPSLRDYNAFVSPSAFILVVTVNNTLLSGRAVDLSEGTLDSFSITGFSTLVRSGRN
jgi:hypothetical protein